MHAIEDQAVELTCSRCEGVACLRGGRLLFEGLDLALEPGEAALVTGPERRRQILPAARSSAGLLRAAAGTVERADAALADEHLALDERQALGRALAFWVDGQSRAGDRGDGPGAR